MFCHPRKVLKVKTLNEKLIKNLVMQINHVWSNLQHLGLFCDVLFSTTLYAVAYKSLMTKAISWLSSFPNTPSTSMKVNLILIELLCSRLLFWWPRKDTYESYVVLHTALIHYIRLSLSAYGLQLSCMDQRIFWFQLLNTLMRYGELSTSTFVTFEQDLQTFKISISNYPLRVLLSLTSDDELHDIKLSISTNNRASPWRIG